MIKLRQFVWNDKSNDLGGGGGGGWGVGGGWEEEGYLLKR